MSDAETTVLLIEDNAGDARLIQELIAEAGATQFRLERADSLSAGLARLEQGRIELVLLDLALSDSTGLDTFTRVQTQAPQMPIIALTGLNDETLAVTSVRAGAQDYLVKGQINSDTLARAIRYAIERKRAEQELRESEHRFRLLIENTSDLFLILNPDYTIAYISPSIERILGRTVAAVVGAKITDFIDPQQLPEVIAATEHRARTPGPSPFLMPVRVRHADGSWRILEGMGSNLFHQPGVSGLVINARDITERKRAEEALRESEAKLRKAQHFAHIGSWTWNIKTNHLDWSDEMYNIFGLDKQTFSGVLSDVIAQAIHPDDRAKVEQSNLDVINEGKPSPLDYRVVLRDGTIRVVWAEAGELIRDEAGAPSVLSGTVQDITERKRAEEERLQFLNVLEASLNEIYIFNADTLRFQYVNNGALRNLGYSRDAIETMTPIDLKPEFNEVSFRSLLRPLLRGEQEQLIFQTVHRRADASLYPIEVHLQLVEHNGAQAFLAIILDITERKRTKDALRQAETRYRDIFENATEGIFQSTPAGKFITVNPAFARMLGYNSPQEMVAMVTDIARQVYVESPRRDEFVRLMAEQGNVTGFEFQMRRKDSGILWVSENVRAVRDSEGSVLLYEGMVEDITKRKQAEEALRERNNYIETILENAPIGFAVNTIDDGKGVFVGSKFEEIYGVPRGSINTVEEYFERVYLDPIFREQIRARIMTDMASGDATRMRWENIPITTIKGEHKVVTAINIPLLDRNLMVSTVQDVTERNRAEQALRQSEDEYRQLFQNNPNPMWAYDPETLAFLAVNDAAVSHYGYSRDEFLAMTIKDIRPPEDIPALMEAAAHLPVGLKDPKVWRHRKKDGTIIYVEISTHWSTFAGKRARIVLANDITERKRAEEEIHRRADQFAALYDTARDLAEHQDLPALLQTIVDRATKLLAVPGGGMYLYDEKRGDLHVVVAKGAPFPIGARVRLGEGMAGRVAQTRQPLIVDNYQTWEGRLPQYAGMSITATIEVPMIFGGELIGVLSIFEPNETARKFSEMDARLLSLFASSAAGAVHNARLLDETRARADEFAALYDITRDLAAQQDVDSLLNMIVQRATELLATSSGAICLYDSVQDDLVIAATHGPELPVGTHIKIGEGAVGVAVQTRAPFRIANYSQWEHRLPGYAENQFGAGAAVPMLYGGELIGALNILEPGSSPRQFTDADLRLLTLFAGLAAGAVHNAGLLDETRARAEQLALLYDAGLTLNRTLEPRAQLELLCSITTKALHADNTAFFRYEAARNDLVFEFGVGLEQELDAVRTLRFPLGAERGLVGWVAQNRTLLNLPDVTVDPRWIATDPAIRAVLWVPVLHNEQLLGVLSASSKRVNAFTSPDERLFVLFANQVAVAMENARLFSETRQRLANLEMLHESGSALNQLLTPKEIGQKTIELLEQKMGWYHTTIRLYHPRNERLELLAFNQPYLEGKPDRLAIEERYNTLISKAGDGLSGWAVQNFQIIRSGDVSHDPRYADTYPGLNSGLYVPIATGQQVLGVISIESEQPNAFSQADENLVATLANQAASALTSALLLEETRQRLTELEAVNQVSTALRAATTLDEMLPLLLDKTLSTFNTDSGLISLYDNASGELFRAVVRGAFDTGYPSLHIRPGEGIVGHVFSTGKAYVSRQVASDPLTLESARSRLPGGIGAACVPIRAGAETIGTIIVAVRLPREITESEVHLMTTIAEIAGNAIHRTRLHAQTEKGLQQLQALHAIDIAITGSTDLNVTLNLLLSQVAVQLNVDAASILLLNPQMQTLEYTAGQGFRTRGIEQSRLQLGEGLAGKAVLERRMMHAPNLQDADVGFARAKLLSGEGFVGYYGVPLISKGQVKGVLDIFQRVPMEPEPAWLDFLQALATQAAIAIDSAQLFENLQRSNQDLERAYDTTIEGWSHALDLRDKETEGHTQRVTEITMRLAKAMGVGDAELVHVRRGVLLHDIGKMGVPDSVLLKPDQLTDAEWKLMRQHPQLAFELLAPIAYLHSALDVPYCHHEKWDGTGYPRGLKGEQIPLAARIFAIVDVWDAVTSDRPYRAAWSKEKAREHIREQSGKHFDPRVVEIFLREIGGQ